MKRAPPIGTKRCVRHVVSQRVLERVLDLGKQPCLVQKLGALEIREDLPEGDIREIRDHPEQGQRHVLADDGRRLKKVPVLGREPVDTRRQNSAHRGWDLERLEIERGSVRPTLAHEAARFDERPYCLLQEERISLGSLDEKVGERMYGGIHYRTSTVVGQGMGGQIGELAVQRYLKPIR